MRIILSSMLLTATLLAGASTPTAANKLRPPKRYPITSRGAVGDGRTLNTKAIQAVIDRCAGSGGGVVVVPRGTFLTGAIFLKQGCNLEVEKGGVLKGSTDPQDYPLVKTRWEGVEREWSAALVNAEGLTGWKPNPNKYATATSLAGPWTEFRDIAPPETNTYGSQSTMMLKVVGSKKTSVIFMADIWKPQTQWDSRYLWMPLEIGGGQLRLPEPKEWTLDVVTGEAVIRH